jgi:hypothetical protein
MKVKFVGIITGLILLAGLPTKASGQNLIGVTGGVVIADVSASDEQQIEGTESRTGAGFGVFYRAMLAPSISVQPEVWYLTKGFEADSVDVSGKFTLNYVQVPVLVQYHLSQGPVSPRIFAGPALAFESRCKISGSEGSVDVEVDCEDLDIATKSTDFSAVFGVGADVRASGFVITGDVRYDLGLSNIDDSGADGSLKNRAWGVFLGAALPVG